MEEIQNYLPYLRKDETYENHYRCLPFFVLSEKPAFSGIICLVDSPEIVFFQNLEKLADPCFEKNIRQTKANLESRLLDKFILSNLFIKSIESNNSAFSTLIPLSKRFLLCDIFFYFFKQKIQRLMADSLIFERAFIDMECFSKAIPIVFLMGFKKTENSKKFDN